MIQNRRTHRSKDTTIALSHQLRACANRAGVEGMLIARLDGLLVAESKRFGPDGVVIAAEVIGMLDSCEFAVGTMAGRTFAAKAFDVGNECYVLCTVGDPTSRTLREMEHAMLGVARILEDTTAFGSRKEEISVLDPPAHRLPDPTCPLTHVP